MSHDLFMLYTHAGYCRSRIESMHPDSVKHAPMANHAGTRCVPTIGTTLVILTLGVLAPAMYGGLYQSGGSIPLAYHPF